MQGCSARDRQMAEESAASEQLQGPDLGRIRTNEAWFERVRGREGRGVSGRRARLATRFVVGIGSGDGRGRETKREWGGPRLNFLLRRYLR